MIVCLLTAQDACTCTTHPTKLTCSSRGEKNRHLFLHGKNLVKVQGGLGEFYSRLLSPLVWYHPPAVDYNEDVILESLKARDPEGLWEQREGETFPDPRTHQEEFMVYCGHSIEQMTAYLYLVTRGLAEGGDIRPLAQHKPYVYSESAEHS